MTATPTAEAPRSASGPPTAHPTVPAILTSGPSSAPTAGTAQASPARASAAATSPATSPASAPPSPTRAPATIRPSATTVVVTDDDSGKTVRLRIGQGLRVRLSKDSYDPPTSSADQIVVRRTSAGGYPSDQPVDAVFEARAAGSADVTAQTDYACFHTEPRCLRPSRVFTLHVIVT